MKRFNLETLNYKRKKRLILTSTMSLILILTSCSIQKPENLTIYPTRPLFDSFDINKTSIQSGNLGYRGFLTTDGNFIYYQSDDSKSLSKSDYDGQNSVVISNRFPSFISILDNNIFFIEGESSGKVFKTNTDGKGESMIVDRNVKSLIVNKDYLFFIDTNDGLVYRSLHDGSKITLLFDLISSQIQLKNEILYIQLDGLSNSVYSVLVDDIKNYDNKTSLDIPTSKTDNNPNSISSAADELLSESKPANNSTKNEISKTPEMIIELIKISNSDIDLKNMNIDGDKLFFVNSKSDSFVSVSENNRVKTFLKKSITSPFIISQQYLYYTNPQDESRLYRVKTNNSSDDEMIINDKVNQFVVCGNSIYYRRENNMEIYRTPIDGGISHKIT